MSLKYKSTKDNMARSRNSITKELFSVNQLHGYSNATSLLSSDKSDNNTSVEQEEGTSDNE